MLGRRMTDAIDTRVGGPLRPLRVRAVQLAVTGGPDRGLTARIDSPTRFVIGTGEDADLRVTDPTVSREHLRLHLSTAGVHARDEGSTNGTWMSGVRIGEATFATSVDLELGDTTVALRVESD